MPAKTLISIAGPTASGKTALAIELAKHYHTVILSADSRQFYREMSIGTAKPTPDELAAAPHEFINSHSITESFNVGDFEQQGMALLNQLFQMHDVVIMVGGSGLYLKAIHEGFDDLPTVDPAIREALNHLYTESGIAPLQQQLQATDPVYYQQVDINNPQRLIRALEVIKSTGQPFSSLRKAINKQRPFHIIKLAIDLPREVLYDRINHRVDIMMQEGLLEEVKSLLPYRHLNALNTVGYTELFDYLDGKTDLSSAIAAIKQNTRRFAKRQLTWFRRDDEIQWLNKSEDLNHLIAQLDQQLKQH
ncbi:tRNA (adenosine(37)-N6)-dimethylallyltransferase MiaA [Mucilaginibacter koreensis]